VSLSFYFSLREKLPLAINGQIAAQRSTLGKMFVTPRKVKIEEIVHKYFPPDKLKPSKKNNNNSLVIAQS